MWAVLTVITWAASMGAHFATRALAGETILGLLPAGLSDQALVAIGAAWYSVPALAVALLFVAEAAGYQSRRIPLWLPVIAWWAGSIGFVVNKYTSQDDMADGFGVQAPLAYLIHHGLLVAVISVVLAAAATLVLSRLVVRVPADLETQSEEDRTAWLRGATGSLAITFTVLHVCAVTCGVLLVGHLRGA